MLSFVRKNPCKSSHKDLHQYISSKNFSWWLFSYFCHFSRLAIYFKNVNSGALVVSAALSLFCHLPSRPSFDDLNLVVALVSIPTWMPSLCQAAHFLLKRYDSFMWCLFIAHFVTYWDKTSSNISCAAFGQGLVVVVVQVGDRQEICNWLTH